MTVIAILALFGVCATVLVADILYGPGTNRRRRLDAETEQYMASLRKLAHENARRMEELDAIRECPICMANETLAQREVCMSASAPNPNVDRHRAFGGYNVGGPCA